MNDMRRIRPPLATAICIYEIFVVVLDVAAYLFLKYFIPHTTDGAVLYHPTLRQNLTSALFSVLAIAAAVALWQMRRSAVIFFGARFALNIGLFVIGFFPSSTAHPAHGSHLLAYLFATVGLALSGLVAGYAYAVTSPAASNPPDTGAQAYT